MISQTRFFFPSLHRILALGVLVAAGKMTDQGGRVLGCGADQKSLAPTPSRPLVAGRRARPTSSSYTPRCCVACSFLAVSGWKQRHLVPKAVFFAGSF